MYQDENNGYYNPYPYGSYGSSHPTGVLDAPPPAANPSYGESTFQQYPPVQTVLPPTPRPPRKRSGRGVAFVLLSLVVLCIFGVGLFAGWEFEQSNSSNTTTAASTTSQTSTTSSSTSSSSSLDTVEAQQEAAIAKVEPAVVELEVTTASGEQIGSGVIVDTKGDIVTNNHVVSGGQRITVVLNNGSTKTAQLVGTSAANDLAVVRIQPFAHMVVATISDSSKLTIGQEVLAIGNPLGITETATHGIVSALNRSVSESTGVTIANAIQTDAAINPGNSGGALINLQGQFVGIPTLTAVNNESQTTANGVSFAIPSNVVQSALQQILSGK